MNIDKRRIFSVLENEGFEETALEVFRFQAGNCEVYNQFISGLGKNPANVTTLEDIPFLPIEFFKQHEIIAQGRQAEVVFTSSGTTGNTQSRHLVSDVKLYEESYRKAIEIFYGDVSQFAVLALLPSYSEREGSSLIYMIDDLIRQSKHSESGYFLYNHEDLYKVLIELRDAGTPTILIGVTYALLDFIETFKIYFPDLIVMETGGMKGRRKELIRQELHQILCAGFCVSAIHSEYGMTELLSQAYSKGAGKFACPAWMRVSTRDINDPLTLLSPGKTGGLNIIDLANLNSCSFIASQDLGKVNFDGTFEVIGRFDNSDVRGCNLMVDN